MRKASDSPVHSIIYASQPDLQFRCDESWSTPKWGETNTDTPGVFIADDDRLYTFDRDSVTCTTCLAKRDGSSVG